MVARILLRYVGGGSSALRLVTLAQDTIRLTPFTSWPAMSERSEPNGGDGGN